MGHFFAASAFSGVDLDELSTAIVNYCQTYGVRCSPLDAPYPVNEKTDALLYGPHNGWCVVTWPEYFNIHDVLLCSGVSRATGRVAVTANVYDGQFWSQEVLNAGALVDQFSTWGDYFAEDEHARQAARLQWQGSPETVAATIGVAASVVRNYYRYVGDQEVGKAEPDDQFPMSDFWVFTDLWRRLGIAYPDDPDAFARRLRVGRGFGDKLPSWEGGPL
jgi:hypothetical protein